MKVLKQPTKPHGNRQWLFDKRWRCSNCRALISIEPVDIEQGIVSYCDQDPQDQRGNDCAECACPCCGHALLGIYPGGGEPDR